MLCQISRLASDTSAILLYANDIGELEVVACREIRSVFDVNMKYWRDVKTAKELSQAMSTVNIAPLEGSKWVLYIDGDALDYKVLTSVFNTIYATCIVVVKTSKYGVFKKLKDSNAVKKLGRYCVSLYGNTLRGSDINLLAKRMGANVDDKILSFLFKRYRRCPKEVAELFSAVHSGSQIETERDVINMIGLGDINVANWLIDVILTRPKNAKSRRLTVGKRLIYLDNLAAGSDNGYATVQRFIRDSLDGFIDIKMEEISGNLNIVDGYEAPENFSDKRRARFERLFRYYPVLRDKISLEYLLAVRSLLVVDNVNPRQAVLNWLFGVYSFVGTRDNDETPRVQKLIYTPPLEYKFNFDDYNNYGDISKTAVKKKAKSPVAVVKKSTSAPKAIAGVKYDVENRSAEEILEELHNAENLGTTAEETLERAVDAFNLSEMLWGGKQSDS